MGARARGDLQRMCSRLRALTGLGAARSRRALRLGTLENLAPADHLSETRSAWSDAPRGVRPRALDATHAARRERLIAIAVARAFAALASSRIRATSCSQHGCAHSRPGRVAPRVDGLFSGQWRLEEREQALDAVLKRLMLGQIDLKRQLAAQEASLRKGVTRMRRAW